MVVQLHGLAIDGPLVVYSLNQCIDTFETFCVVEYAGFSKPLNKCCCELSF